MISLLSTMTTSRLRSTRRRPKPRNHVSMTISSINNSKTNMRPSIIRLKWAELSKTSSRAYLRPFSQSWRASTWTWSSEWTPARSLSWVTRGIRSFSSPIRTQFKWREASPHLLCKARVLECKAIHQFNKCRRHSRLTSLRQTEC